MAYNDDPGELIKSQICDANLSITRKIELISTTNVNQTVQGEPLIIHYLRKKLNLKVLAAFAENGCDFKVHGRDGQTPLNLLVAKKIDPDHFKAFDMLVGYGCDPCEVDNDGNNVIMVAMFMGNDQFVSHFLTKRKAMAKQLVTEKNQFGHDVLALFFLSGNRRPDYPETTLEQLLQLGADISNTDNNGNNCLHHLVRRPDEHYLKTVYDDETSNQDDNDYKYRKDMFTCFLSTLIEAGADNIEQNKSGLIPLQVALSSEPTRSVYDFEQLVPNKDVLELLVPRPDIETMVKEPLKLSVQVWLVAQVTRFGFILHKDNLAAIRASKYCGISSLIEQTILDDMVKPTAEDLKVSLVNKKLKEIKLYANHMSPEEISKLKLVIPDIVSQIISMSDDDHIDKRLVIEKLLSDGLAINVNDLKVALDEKNLNVVQYLLTNMDSSFEDQIKREIPDILIQVLRIFELRYGLYVDQSKTIIENIVNNFNISFNYVNSSNDSAVQCLMDIICKGIPHSTKPRQVFDLLVNMKDFDIEQTVKLEERDFFGTITESIELRPIEMALKYDQFEMVIKFIMAGADCRGISYDNFRRNMSATELLKLLHHLGIYVNIDRRDLIFNWAQRQPIKSLQELAAMAVRRNCTRKELNEAIADFVLPENFYRYLDLKHLNLDHELYLDQRSMYCGFYQTEYPDDLG